MNKLLNSMKNLKYVTNLLILVAITIILPSSILSDEIPIAEHYEGATVKLMADIDSTIIYPPTAKRNRIQGTQNVRVTLLADGKLINLRCLNSIGAGCCEEAKRVLKTLKFKAPGYQANYIIPVKFKL